MINKMFYDAFTEEYTLKINEYSPPERYVLTLKGPAGVYVDHWEGEHNGVPGYALDIAYASDEYYSEEHDRRFYEMCKEQGFKATHLRYFTLPEEKFNEYVKRFKVEEQ